MSLRGEPLPNQSLHPCLRQVGAGGGQKLIPMRIISGQAAEAEVGTRYARKMNH